MYVILLFSRLLHDYYTFQMKLLKRINPVYLVLRFRRFDREDGFLPPGTHT